MASKRLTPASTEDAFLGYRIRKLGDVYVATPQEWAQGRAQLLAAANLPELRREIERWWYEVGA